MERMFPESQVKNIINKAILEGKISATKYYLDFVESELKSHEEWFEHLNETEFMSERWYECNSAMGAFAKIKKELSEVLKLLEKKKE